MGEGRVDATVPMAFSADETCDVGSDTATPVTDDLEEGRTAFTGRVGWVEIDISGGEDADHIISAEERMRVAMARQ
jgi:arylsulfatase